VEGGLLGYMNVRLLIESITRQTTVLIAELATSSGIRAPLANVADRVFLELTKELEAHGVSRTVSADMFGMGLRTYLRRIRRYDESSTQQGKSLWEAVLEYVQSRSVMDRAEILVHFARDEEALVRGVLQDLTDSGLLFRSGAGAGVVYRAARADETGSARAGHDADALDNLLWALVRREGPLTKPALLTKAGLADDVADRVLERLLADGRIEETAIEGTVGYRAKSIIIPLGARAGWEAAVYDHFRALVKTIVCKLHQDADGARPDDRIGGSTYSFDVWPGHPFTERVYAQLARFRDETSTLRREVDEHNTRTKRPRRYDRVTAYMGQCVVEEEDSDGSS
jgi:hypothetical protein